MPPKGKPKSAPNQHDKRHESGLAAPGKRVTKQRSNGHLNGGGQPPANGKPAQSAVLPPPLPSTGLHSGLPFPRPPKEPAAADVHAAAKDYAEDTHRDRTASDASLEEVVSPGGDMGDNTCEAGPGALHTDAYTAASKVSSPPAGSTLAIVSTILSYYPLRDAISILILLLSLPPTLVLVIQSLFASLTFVPPTAGISLSTLPNIKEMFNASSLGYPALATILLVDLIFYLFWLPVWKPMQSMFLDLSQTVIAVSLSGAAASNGTPTCSILTCSSIVCVVHVLRYKAIHLTALDYLRSVLHKMDLGFDVNASSAFSSFIFSPPSQHGWLYTAIRTMLGIHIVSQGVTTCIRRSLASANERSSNTPAITKSDPEAAAGADAAPRSNSDLVQSSPAPNSDARSPGLSTVHRDGKVRESSSKKKRKQANQVRSQQPLWAAIASTKVTFVKEMEQRDAADDAKEAVSMDNNTTTSTFANSVTNFNDRVWISEVHDTEIFFGVELSPQSILDNMYRQGEPPSISAAIDKTKPFFIRVNGAAWSSTRIMATTTGEDTEGKWWGGEIFGLAPMSSYHCEIVGMVSQAVLSSVNLITLPAPTAEQAASAPILPQHQALRPSSPITTLKQSIQQAEVRLMETRNRTRKSKKDQRAANADVKREIAALRSKLDNSGGVDDKQARRLQQITQHKNQAEEATAELKKQIDSFGDLPADKVSESERKRRAWQSAMDAKSAAVRDHEELKAEADRELSLLKAEIGKEESKREKLAIRLQQRKDELEHAQLKQKADLSAKQKHNAERSQKRAEQEKEERDLQYHIGNMHAETEALAQKNFELYQQASALQNWGTGPPPGYPGYSSPPTPEGHASNPNGQLSPVNGFSTFNPGQFPPGFHPNQPLMNNHAPRGRSSSMLSQYSGFTENNEDYIYDQPQQYSTWPMPGHTVAGAPVFDDRKESEGSGPSTGSGSGSGSGTNGSTASNSPRPDATAKPFVPASARPSLPPIGPPSKQAKQSPGIAHAGAVGSGR